MRRAACEKKFRAKIPNGTLCLLDTQSIIAATLAIIIFDLHHPSLDKGVFLCWY